MSERMSIVTEFLARDVFVTSFFQDLPIIPIVTYTCEIMRV